MRFNISSRLVFQLSNILLMGFQSFLVPLLVGFSGYGKAMLYLAPVYLYQSIFEPVFQGVYGKRLETKGEPCKRFDVDFRVFFMSLLGFVVFTFSWFCLFDEVLPVVLFFSIGILYLLSTNLQVFLLFEDQYLFVGSSVFISALVYVLAYFISGLGADFIILGNLFFFASLSVFLSLRLIWMRATVSFSDRFNWKDVLSHASTRFAYIFSGNGLLIVFGLAGHPSAQLGAFKFSLSLMNAGRYFNPVPLVSLQKVISGFVADADAKNLFVILKTFSIFSLAYGVALFFGWWLYCFLLKNVVCFSYMLLLTPVYLLIQPASYYLAVRGYAVQQFLSAVVVSFIASAISFYDMWLAFLFMIVAIILVVVLLIARVNRS